MSLISIFAIFRIVGHIPNWVCLLGLVLASAKFHHRIYYGVFYIVEDYLLFLFWFWSGWNVSPLLCVRIEILRCDPFFNAWMLQVKWCHSTPLIIIAWIGWAVLITASQFVGILRINLFCWSKKKNEKKNVTQFPKSRIENIDFFHVTHTEIEIIDPSLQHLAPSIKIILTNSRLYII